MFTVGTRVRLIKPISGFSDYGALPVGTEGVITWKPSETSIWQEDRFVQWDGEHWAKCGVMKVTTDEIEEV